MYSSPHPLPFGNHKFVFYVCICFCFVSSFVSFRFHIWYHIFVFLCLNLFHSLIKFRTIHVTPKGNISFFFYVWVIFQCICKSYLFLLICWWKLRLLPCLGYSDAMNIEVQVHLSCKIRVFLFSGYMPRSEMAGSYGNSYF